MNPQINNKSRPEKPLNIFGYDDYQLDIISQKRVNDNRKLSSKSKKKSPTKSSPTSMQKKYFPGEFIYDTKGQMAEIKYIGECHKGSGTWFGIEFIDGTLGKHNGTINGHTYFRGEYRRCDMIRGDKIRSKASPNKLKNKNKNKHKSNKKPPHKNNKLMHRVRRSNSDLLQMESMSLSDLSFNFSDNYFKKKKKHKRVASQPTSLMMHEKDRSYSLFNNKIRDDKITYNRQYKHKSKQIKTVKKEKYKGNKYILAMEQETEKRIHKRIGLIKTEKKRVKKQKHERTSSKVQQILKQKQLEKEHLNKLNAENKLKELQRIQLAKQKSKKKLKIKPNNRIRSNSYQPNNNTIKKTHKTLFHSPDINKLNRNRNNINIPSIIIDETDCKDTDIDDVSLTISTTPLANDIEFKLTPVPSNTSENNNEINDNILDDDDDSFDDMETPELHDTPSMDKLLRSYSESDITSHSHSYIHKMDAMYPMNSDSKILLQELDTINSDSNEYPSPMPINTDYICVNQINSLTPKKPKKKKMMNVVPLLKENDDMKDLEDDKLDFNDTSFHFPMYNNRKKQRSNSCDSQLFKRSISTPLFDVYHDKGTDYWIQKYNQMNEKLNDTQNQYNELMKNKTEEINISKPEAIQISKSNSEILEIKHENNRNDNEESDTFNYLPMGNGKCVKQRSQSLASPSLLKRTESAPIIVNDDKGTDYWIKQYNKANKKKSKRKTKRKSKCKRKKSSRSKTLINNKNKHIIGNNEENKNEKNNCNILPITIPLLSSNKSNKSNKSNHSVSPYFQSDIDDNHSVISTMSTLSALSNDPSLDLTINSNISSISSITSSPDNSAKNTPNDAINIVDVNKNLHQMIANISYQSKYGVYPFKRKHENYINKKFTGIVRIGHRYLLRDGRIGIVRYINQTRFAPGTWYGFELDKSDGEHNGIVNNIKYFLCQNNYGTFVKKSQIAQYIGRDNTKSLSKNHLKHLNNVNINNYTKLSL